MKIFACLPVQVVIFTDKMTGLILDHITLSKYADTWRDIPAFQNPETGNVAKSAGIFETHGLLASYCIVY